MRALLLAFTILASSRPHVPMGTALRHADTVVIANVAGGKVTITEVLKGAAKEPRFWYDRPPADATQIALLMERDGMVSHWYREADAVRALLRVQKLRGERERLIAVRDLMLRAKEPQLYREQLVADFREMREPANLQLVIDLLGRGDRATKLAMIDVLAFIGDVRAVPALRRALDSEVGEFARGALQTHFPGTLPPRQPKQVTDYMRVVTLLEKENEAATRPIFLRMLSQPSDLEAAVLWLPEWTERSIAASPRESRKMLPLLDRLARSDNYLYKAAAAKALRALRHPDAAPPLLALLDTRDSLFDESKRIAAFALYDLGGTDRAAAAAKLPPGTFDGANDVPALIAKRSEWAFYRLGELRDPRAIAPLARTLATDYPLRQIAAESLVRIGGAKVEEAMLPLLREPNLETRRLAMDVLFQVQRRRFLPLLRRMLADRDFGIKATALTYLAHLGDASDLKVLVPQSDFWTGDRENHYWLMSAIAEIRRRHAR
jgi:HEAT repeat protein